jgi:hypothetical protein
MDRFYGKYLGIVVDNQDPMSVSRLKVRVPEVFGDESAGWFLPSSPYAGDGIGFSAVPPVGSMVFVEWPAGDTTRIGAWSGGMWTNGGGVSGAGPDTVLLVTPGGHRVVLDDTSGSETVTLESSTGATVTMDQAGLTLTFGSQKLALTQASVSINDGALTVM